MIKVNFFKRNVVAIAISLAGLAIFADCSGLTEITSHAVQPPEAHYFAFYNVPTDIISVHVPCASVDAYQNAIMWLEFTNYGECISTVPETGVVIDEITWATCNVDAPGTFASSPESYGMFYLSATKVVLFDLRFKIRFSLLQIYVFPEKIDKLRFALSFYFMRLESSKFSCIFVPENFKDFQKTII